MVDQEKRTGHGKADSETCSQIGSIAGTGEARREQAERDRRLEKLAVHVLAALDERDATIAATEYRAGAALQAMINDEHLTISEAVQWCAGVISQREATRLRQSADPSHG